MRFNKIRLHNFKGVEDMEFDMAGFDAIILGGKNGFGKTTIFDALELVLTGRIARYSGYRDSFIDGRRTFSQEERPLVCKQNVEEVRVDVFITILLEGGQCCEKILTRDARTRDMKNPVDFDVFNELKIRDREEDEPVVAAPEIISEFGLDDFVMYYTTLNYMSQEESTRFIKSKDTKRVEEVQFLFNTYEYDRRIDKIDKVLLKALKELRREADMQKQQKEQTIAALRQFGLNEVVELSGYQELFEDVEYSWDEENPRLSNEDFNELLREGGTLDSIIGMIEKYNEYRKYKKNQYFSKILEKLDDFAFYLQYRKTYKQFTLWDTYQHQTVVPFNQLELQNVATYNFSLSERFQEQIGDEVFTTIQGSLKRVKELYAAATASQRAYNEVLTLRNQLVQQLREHSEQLVLHQCPLCGFDYESTQSLMKAVETALTIQLSSLEALNDNVSEAFENYKLLVSKTIAFFDGWFEVQGVTAESFAQFRALDWAALANGVKWLDERALLEGFPKEDIEQTKSALGGVLTSQMEKYDEQLDYENLKRVFETYVRYIPQARRTIDSIQQKRSYLLRLWNRGKSQQMAKLTEELNDIQQQMNKYGVLERQLNAVKNSIIAERDAYLRKVITDVEILFYVYSGRIMQDSFYGRGLFLKNVQGKYIYFVSKYNSDVDALYKMSSGQLVALMMALLLSLNKLYSETRFLAIDDPVQTIDDINVWGFIETLRHEFKDYQFLFSTHELSYGSFLRYKLSNMNINAKYIDMMDLRKG